LVLLGQAFSQKTEEEQLAVIGAGDGTPEAFEIAKALLDKKSWSTIAKLAKACEDDYESVRRVILGYMSSVLLGGGAKADRAFQVIDICREPWYDSGKAMMAACLYECSK
jgi:hypothetical protein